MEDHGSDVNVYSDPQHSEEMNFMHVLSPQQWVVATSSASGFYSPKTDSAEKAPSLSSEPCVYIPNFKIDQAFRLRSCMLQ